MAYAQDGTFFVEDDDFYPPQNRMQTAARLMARNPQEIIANELSRLASDEYLEDIMQHMSRIEDETLPDANLIDMQREIQWYMRPYLIDFLLEAHCAFALLPETLFLTVNLLDRYCSRRVVYKQHYQLVGCAALLIAAKYGDHKDRVPQIYELNNMCCGLYDSGMFTQMEMHVLNTLEWNIGHPTVDFYSSLMSAEEGDCSEVKNMAAYLAEISLFHRDFVSAKPSVVAKSSLVLARAILNKPEANDVEWDQSQNMTLITLSQHLHQPSQTLARKYASSHYSRVSVKLAEFMAHQAAMARRASPTPQPSAEAVAAAARQSNVYATPQKIHGAAVAGVAEGYMTPPITPDANSFGIQVVKESYQPPAPRCPITPTPPSQQYGYDSYPQHAQVPQSHQHHHYTGYSQYGMTHSGQHQQHHAH